ncbi:deleted in malignant brain tumors 1 protein [Biomphalaria pfeifferi]|uniref:Deleted in malignant brain tumors 1 protein n=1 Tax=Biomphalaria pfeifferi TaxID=112525 RepID=A0AAD8F792_BIOPF|nr:deleted in malignant brain tumors 1 protein [Biomphalaria pfeifferi]
MITPTSAYTKCIKPETGKTKYGNSCTSNSQCLTDFCSNSKCSCPEDSFIDAESGLCVKDRGDIEGNQGECGYIISPSGIGFGDSVSWTINGAAGTYITLVLLDIDMDSSSCAKNYLMIVEGSTSLLNKICYANNKTTAYFASKSAQLTVSYGAVSGDYRGFRAVYYIRSESSDLIETAGYIASPGYPVSYNEKASYVWVITALSGNTITLSVQGNTEENYDFVNLYDGSNRIKSLTGFTVSYEVYGLYGGLCNSSETCREGLTCNGNVCSCSAFELYEQSTSTCKNYTTYGNRCRTTCLPGLTCSEDLCGCTSSQYYNHINGACNTKLPHGSECSLSEECAPGLLCYNSLCRCSTSQYYDTSTTRCKSGVLYGEICTSEVHCVEGLQCILNICNCSSTEYFETSLRTCENRAVYGSTCTSLNQCVEELLCLSNVCNCLSTQYFDQSTQSCIDSK